jgi:branched-chain amino acid transport system permease protein
MDNQTQKTSWRIALEWGLIAGVVLLYVGLVGMLEAFQERDVIRDVLTLAQLLIVIPAYIAAYKFADRTQKADQPWSNIIGGVLLIGVLTALPSVVLLLIDGQVIEGIRDILVNVNRDWAEVITFDNRDNELLGSALLTGLLVGVAGIGLVMAVLPQRLYRPLLYATGIVLTVGVFGETVGLILEQVVSEDVLDAIFRRDTLQQEAALVLFGLSLVSVFIWGFAGEKLQSSYSDLPRDTRKISRYVGWALVAAFFLVLPFIIGRALSDVAVTVGLFVLMGFGLNIAIGLAGLLDLGYVTNYAVGAYIMAVLTSAGPLGMGDEFFTFWLVIPVALLAAMFTGFMFAIPVLKMRGDYLAIATLGFGEIIGKLAVSDWLKPIIGGAQGIQFIPKPNFFGTELTNPEQLYYIVLAGCVLTLFVSIRLNNSRTGRQWMAIREDEDAAAAMGINVPRAKLLAFTLSAATGGVAGAIFAAKVGAVFPNSFTVFISINVLSLIIVGGLGSNPGIFIGALVLVGMPELLREFSEFRWLLYGAVLIYMMIRRPEGLWPSRVQRRELNRDIEDIPTDDDPQTLISKA